MVSEFIEPTTPERGLTGHRLLQTNRFEARKLNGIDGVDIQVIHVFTKYPRPTRTPAIEVLTITNRKDERGRHESDWYVCYRPSREFCKELDFIFEAMDCANLVECGGWRDVYLVGELYPLLREIMERLEDAVMLNDERLNP